MSKSLLLENLKCRSLQKAMENLGAIWHFCVTHVWAWKPTAVQFCDVARGPTTLSNCHYHCPILF